MIRSFVLSSLLTASLPLCAQTVINLGGSQVGGTLTLSRLPANVVNTLIIHGDSYGCSVQAPAFAGCNNVNLGGYGATLPANSYAMKLAALQGLGTLSGLSNYAQGGAEAADVASMQAYAYPSPGPSTKSTVMVGLNDALHHGPGSYEAVYQLAHNATIAWLALPPQNKFAGTACDSTGVPDTTYAAMTGVHFYAAGTMTCSLSTPGTPIYIGYMIKDGSTGSFTYALNSGAATTVSTAAPTAIATTSGGTTQSVGLIRIPSSTPGPNVLHLNVTAGDVSIYWVGFAPSFTAGATAKVFVGGVSYLANNASAAATLAYNNDAYNDAALLASDGLAVKFVDVRQFQSPSAANFFSDGIHPNDNGYANITRAFASAMITGAASFPSMTDSTGLWPGPLDMVETSGTGYGPQWFMDNTAQGGIRWSHVLAGPSDPNSSVGCDYLLDVTHQKVIHEQCPLQGHATENLYTYFNLGMDALFVGGQTGQTVTPSSGYGAVCAANHACSSVSGTVVLTTPSSPTNGVLFTVSLPSIVNGAASPILNCTVSMVPAAGTTMPVYTFGSAPNLLTVKSLSALVPSSTYYAYYSCGS